MAIKKEDGMISRHAIKTGGRGRWFCLRLETPLYLLIKGIHDLRSTVKIFRKEALVVKFTAGPVLDSAIIQYSEDVGTLPVPSLLFAVKLKGQIGKNSFGKI